MLALVAALISGVANFLTKVAVTAVGDPLTFTFVKNVLVATMLAGLFVVGRKWSGVRTLHRKQLMQLGLIGLVGGSVPFALYFTGLAQTSAINAALLHKTLIVWVFVFALPFLKERMPWNMWAGVAVIFVANFISGWGFTGFKYNAGEMMILMAAMLWGVENVIAKKVLRNVSSLVVAVARMVLGSALLFVVMLFLDRPLVPTTLGGADYGLVVLTSVLLFGYVMMWYRALQLAPATYVAALLLPATLVTNILSAIFVTHTMSGQQAASGILFVVGSGVLICSMRHVWNETKLEALVRKEL